MNIEIKIKLKSWRELKAKYGLTKFGSIASEPCVSQLMYGKSLKTNRVVPVILIDIGWVWYDEYTWLITDSMIKEFVCYTRFHGRRRKIKNPVIKSGQLVGGEIIIKGNYYPINNES